MKECKEGKVALLLGKVAEGVSDTDGRGGRMCYALDRKVVTCKEGFVVWRANGQILVPPPSMNSWTLHILLSYFPY